MRVCEDYGSYLITKKRDSFYIIYVNNKIMLSVKVKEPEYLEILNTKY